MKILLTITTAALLALAGCGGDDENGADTAPVDTGPAATQTDAGTGTQAQTDTGAGAAPTDTAAREPEPVDCGDVAFEPNTDAGAFGISAIGIRCEVARDVAAAAEGSGGRNYEAEGFDCSGNPRGGALPTIEWTCARKGAEITFSTS